LSGEKLSLFLCKRGKKKVIGSKKRERIWRLNSGKKLGLGRVILQKEGAAIVQKDICMIQLERHRKKKTVPVERGSSSHSSGVKMHRRHEKNPLKKGGMPVRVVARGGKGGVCDKGEIAEFRGEKRGG